MKHGMLQKTQKMTTDPAVLVGTPNRGVIRPALDSGSAAASPARSVMRGHQPEERARWSPRATLAVSGGVSLLLWGAIGWVIFGLR